MEGTAAREDASNSRDDAVRIGALKSEIDWELKLCTLLPVVLG